MASYDSGQVAALLRQIGHHDELLAEVYTNNAITQDDDNHKQIALLHKTGLLRPDDELGDFRVSTELKRMLNRLMRKQSGYRQLTDMGKVIDALDDSVKDYQLSLQSNQQDDADHYLDQLDDLLYEAKDNLNVSLDNMHHAISGQFGFVATLSAKVRENERALNYAQKLLIELQQIDPETCYEWINWPCPNDFARKITGFIHWFNQTLPKLRHIIEMMRQSLFRLRQDEKQASQLRGMARYLRQHPEFELAENLFEQPNLPQALKLAAPLQLKTYVDVHNTAIEEPLMALVHALRKQAQPAPIKTRETNSVSTDIIEDLPWQADFFEQQVELLFETAIINGQPISALEYWQQQLANWEQQENEIAPKAWIELVFSCYCQLTNELQQAIQLEMVGEQVAGTTANFRYSDIVVGLAI